MALCLVLAIHVTDEALTGFLSVYDPMVGAIRGRFPFLPLPAFTFGVWLGGLIMAVVALLILSRFAFRPVGWVTPLAYIFGALMLVNGLMHLVGSVYFGRLMPGVYSAPLLVAASIYLLANARLHGNNIGFCAESRT